MRIRRIVLLSIPVPCPIPIPPAKTSPSSSTNAPSAKINFIITELASYDSVSIQRAYSNWKKPAISGWEKVLHEYAIQPIQHFDIVKGKNASDMALLIEAMDILYTNDAQRPVLPIVPARNADKSTDKLYLPFEGDRGLSLIISKAVLLVEDNKITNSRILSQIKR